MRKLPPCSVHGCEHLAGAIVGGLLLCGAHAIEHPRMRRPGDLDRGRREQPSRAAC